MYSYEPEVEKRLIYKSDVPPGDANEPEVEKRLVWAPSGKRVLPHVANVMAILEHHSAWQGVLAYDEARKQVNMLKAPPARDPFPGCWPEAFPAVFRWEHYIEVAIWLQSGAWLLNVSSARARKALVVVAQRNPVRIREIEGDYRIPNTRVIEPAA